MEVSGMSVVSVCDLVLLPLVQKSRASHVLPVEAFVIRIKMESNDQHSFGS